ncbi:MAG: hypothetical protein NTX52_10065, partial [Planctomycetota bacterium]|nr:hypothetical protein [Planctomycetota bacterium]
LLKTDASGNIEWDSRFGGADYVEFSSVQQTKDGGYIAAGWTGSFGHGLEDVYLVKTDGSGNMTWERAFGGTGRDYGYSVLQTCDGGYVVAGVSFLLARHISDAYLIKTDSSGNFLWERKYGGSESFEYAYSVDQTSDGGYILAGASHGIYLN